MAESESLLSTPHESAEIPNLESFERPDSSEISSSEQLETFAANTRSEMKTEVDDVAAEGTQMWEAMLKGIELSDDELSNLLAETNAQEQMDLLEDELSVILEDAEAAIDFELSEAPEIDKWTLSPDQAEKRADIVKSTEGKDYLQEVKNINELLEQGEKVLPEYTEKINGLGQKLGAEVMIGPLKGKDRANEKIEEYKTEFGDEGVHHLLDVVRGSLVFDSMDDLYDALPVIQEELDVVRIKPRIEKAVQNGGYGDMLLNVKVGGMVSELQLHVKPILEKKSSGHTLYDQERALDPLASQMAEKGQLEVPTEQVEDKMYSILDSKLEAIEEKIDQKKAEGASEEEINALEEKYDQTAASLYDESRKWLKGIKDGGLEEIPIGMIRTQVDDMVEKQKDLYEAGWNEAKS